MKKWKLCSKIQKAEAPRAVFHQEAAALSCGGTEMALLEAYPLSQARLLIFHPG